MPLNSSRDALNEFHTKFPRADRAAAAYYLGLSVLFFLPTMHPALSAVRAYETEKGF